ncbi:MAG: DNA-binding response regulator, partial [Actinobacteria bacterium]|nr:DNA-binding response regulator [Actinomycetota bacterium]
MSVQVAIGFAAACDKNDFELIGSAPTVSELLEQIGSRECQVVVTDLSLADGSLVAENVERIVATGAAVLIFSIADKPNLMRAAVRAGATAIVPKSQPVEDLMEAIRL